VTTSPDPAEDRARGQADIADLVERYRALGKTARGYSEARTVNEFIVPLFAALGWDVRNTSTTNEVVPEEAVSRGRVDWAFRLRSVPRFYLEAKRPSVDLDDPEPAKQAITYAYNKGVTWAVLTNFERLRVYNADWDAPNPNLNLFYELRWEDYPTDERLWWLSRESVAQGVLDAEAEKVGKVLKKTPVGERLFSDLLTFRTDLRNYFSTYNAEVDGAEIDHAVQRLLDRLIFIRTAEDRHIEEYHLRPLVRRLQDTKKIDTVWPQLLTVFREFDARYDSQLFATQRLDTLDTEWFPIQETLNGLYGTKNGSIEYDFSAIDADVLGGVYEQYLGQLAKATPVTKKKPAKKAAKAGPKADTRPFRKAQGVYYTPKWVVRLIVHATVGRMLEERSPDEIREIRILDPACGSGSFLIEAFRVLADYWREKEPPKDAAAEQAQRVDILTRNIFGVDLDPQAVEIAQLNLLLVALVDRTLLPDLSRNVVVGNTLVDAGRPDAFDVAKAFPFTSNPGRFGVVLGNPPYVRSQSLPDPDREYFKGRFRTATGSFDLYQLFLERALELTMAGGRIGFIVPGKFLSGSSGQSVLLDHLYEMGNIEVLVDAMRHKVFESALTYPVILVEQRAQEPGGHTAGLVRVIYSDGPVITWVDEPGRVSPTLVDEDLPAGWTTIDSIARVSQALVTGADNVFALTGAWREPTARLRSGSLKKVVEVESELLKPLVSGSRQVSRFAVAEPEDWLLFPYRDGKLIAATTMETTYPLAWAYLEENRARLEARDGGDMKGPNWYGFSRTQNLSAIWHPKVIVPYMNIAARAAADPTGRLAIVNVTTGGYFVAPNDVAHLDYLTAALNSRYAEAWWRKRATPHAGGYFGLTARAIGLLPVPDPAALSSDILTGAGTPTDAEDDPFVRILGERLREVLGAAPDDGQSVAVAAPRAAYEPERGRG
jgi:methylase of polypeptide subunit release factors